MEKELILLVGAIGSGKSTMTKTLVNDTSIVISQDEMGRKKYLEHFNNAIHEGIPRVIVDRMNFNEDQRAKFIAPARKLGYVITIFEFEFDYETSFKRCMERENHPTIKKGDAETINKVLDMYKDLYEKPAEMEYDNLNVIRSVD